MAGAGYKLFNTGDVLTAAQVNTYLMQQSVMVFANSAARTSALSGVLAEGMLSYLQDTNAVEKYDGSSWGAIGAGDIEGVTAGTGLSGGGTSGTVTLSIATQQSDLIVKGFEEDVNVVAEKFLSTYRSRPSTDPLIDCGPTCPAAFIGCSAFLRCWVLPCGILWQPQSCNELVVFRKSLLCYDFAQDTFQSKKYSVST